MFKHVHIGNLMFLKLARTPFLLPIDLHSAVVYIYNASYFPRKKEVVMGLNPIG